MNQHIRVQNLIPIGQAIWQLSHTVELFTFYSPKMPPDVSRGSFFCLCPFQDESAHACQIGSRSVQSFGSCPRFSNCIPPETPKMPPGLPRSSFVSVGTIPRSIHIDVPNLVMIGPAVWPPIVARQTHTHSSCII